jgi:hypothetical protein
MVFQRSFRLSFQEDMAGNRKASTSLGTTLDSDADREGEYGAGNHAQRPLRKMIGSSGRCLYRAGAALRPGGAEFAGELVFTAGALLYE